MGCTVKNTIKNVCEIHGNLPCLKHCMNSFRRYCDMTLFAFDYRLFEWRNVVHEKISLIL